MKTKNDASQELHVDRYTYRVSWSAADSEFVASVLEFPSLSWIATTRNKALNGLTSLVEEVLQDMIQSGEEIPQPWDEREFSGKFNLRLGPDLHKRIALEAAVHNESMNSYIIKKLGDSLAS